MTEKIENGSRGYLHNILFGLAFYSFYNLEYFGFFEKPKSNIIKSFVYSSILPSFKRYNFS